MAQSANTSIFILGDINLTMAFLFKYTFHLLVDFWECQTLPGHNAETGLKDEVAANMFDMLYAFSFTFSNMFQLLFSFWTIL
jgi:hypothetical protein